MQLGCLARFQSARAVALAATALGIASCSDAAAPSWPNQELERSAHFRYFVRPDDSRQCAGITRDLERQRSLVFDYFGALQTGEPIDYYKFRDGVDLREHSPCPKPDSPEFSRSCQAHHQVWTYEPMQQHELIHAYLEPRGLSAQFLVEGIAHALSCGLDRRPVSDLSLADLVAWNENEDLEARYDEASLFVGHLLSIGGPGAFLSLYDQLRWGASLARVGAAIQAVYGTSADELYAASQNTAPGAGCVPLWECSGPAWDTSTSTFNAVSVCGEPSYTPFDVTEPSLFAGFVQELHSCLPELVLPVAPWQQVMPHVVALEPGRYFLGMSGNTEAIDATFRSPAQLLPLARAVVEKADCSTLPNIDLPLGGEIAFVPRTLLQGRAGPLFLRWNDSQIPGHRQFAGPDARLALTAQCSDGVDVAVCDGCDESACHALCSGSNSPAVSPDIPEDLVLRLSIDPAALDTIITISPTVSAVPL